MARMEDRMTDTIPRDGEPCHTWACKPTRKLADLGRKPEATHDCNGRWRYFTRTGGVLVHRGGPCACDCHTQPTLPGT